MSFEAPVFSAASHCILPTKLDVALESTQAKSSNVLLTDAFPFLSKAAVAIVRQEAQRLREKCQFTSSMAPVVFRGLAKHSAFIRAMFLENPALVEKVSEAMGVDLIPHPTMYEIAHMNSNRSDPEDTELRGQREKKQSQDDEAGSDEDQIFKWHFDSQPYVMVLLLSDPGPEGDKNTVYIDEQVQAPTKEQQQIDMHEGDEAISQGVRKSLCFPAEGYAYVIKGSELRHCVTSCKGRLRLSMVTSWVHRDVRLPDPSNLYISGQYTPYLPLLRDYVTYRSDRVRQLLLLAAQENTDLTAEITRELDAIQEATTAHNTSSLN
jgi:hypothetical protein